MPAGAKRKRTAAEGSAPEMTGEELKELKKIKAMVGEDQYYQGVGIPKTRSDLEGVERLLMTPFFHFQSPVVKPMTVEVLSGTRGPGSGGLWLRTRASSDDLPGSPAFMVPFKHVEQVIIIDESALQATDKSTSDGHRVIIIPTAFVGASPLKRQFPKIISFTLPDRNIGGEFKGLVGDAADAEETFRSLLTRVLNEQLAPSHKSVVDVSSDAKIKRKNAPVVCDAILKGQEEEEEPVDGRLFFLEPGILFWSQLTSKTLYLTCDSTPDLMLIYNHDLTARAPEAAHLSLICRTSEPWYEKAQEGRRNTRRSTSKQDEGPILLSFDRIGTDSSGGISRYAEKHSFELEELEQLWYDLKKRQPATGWIPRTRGFHAELASMAGFPGPVN
ncbi:hypothetical protein diail_8408 [Diaporthe ilicicola]|nr:hypothetical protein diail_8408 [Diaporthe ilicicola]